MGSLKDAVDDFLAQERIAVAGVSRQKAAPANAIYRKLRDAGYQVFAVNPNATELEGDPSYPELASIPDGVDGVVIATHPDVASDVVEECSGLGISRVWFHRSFGQGSVSEEAVELCEQKGISAIPGGCPMMFREPVDLGHKCMRWFLGVTGKLPDADTYFSTTSE